jgi:hypothetical protein
MNFIFNLNEWIFLRIFQSAGGGTQGKDHFAFIGMDRGIIVYLGAGGHDMKWICFHHWTKEQLQNLVFYNQRLKRYIFLNMNISFTYASLNCGMAR